MMYDDSVIKKVTSAAVAASSLVKYGIWQHILYHQALYKEQSDLLAQIQSYSANFSGDQIKAQVMDTITQDIKITYQLNDQIAQYPANTVPLPYAFKTNKMIPVLEGAKVFLEDATAFNAILKGQARQPSPFESENLPIVVSEYSPFYGSTQATVFSAALYELYQALSKMAPEAEYPQLVHETSAMMHVVTIPEQFFDNNAISLSTFLEDYSFGVDLGSQRPGLLYIHSGYAFGGYREDASYYQDEKIFGPEDCSSWIAKLLNTSEQFSTIDLMYSYRASMPDKKHDIDLDWLKTPLASELSEKLIPVVYETFDDIHAGDIMSFRFFDTADYTGPGYAGHTTVVLGQYDAHHFLTLNYSRNMPEEGFGVSIYDARSDENRAVFFQRPQETLRLDDIVSKLSDYVLSSSLGADNQYDMLGQTLYPEQWAHYQDSQALSLCTDASI